MEVEVSMDLKYEINEDREVMFLRNFFGMEQLRQASRQCLKCYNEFHSQGRHNRICANCRRNTFDQDLRGRK